MIESFYILKAIAASLALQRLNRFICNLVEKVKK